MKREQLERAKEIEHLLDTFYRFKKALVNNESLQFDSVGINLQHPYYYRLNQVYLEEVCKVIDELNNEFEKL